MNYSQDALAEYLDSCNGQKIGRTCLEYVMGTLLTSGCSQLAPVSVLKTKESLTKTKVDVFVSFLQ